MGAFALVRSDIWDTLPGVAIAISLVPPLAVVGLTLESGALSRQPVLSCSSARTSPPSSRWGQSCCLVTQFASVAAASGHDVAELSRLSLVAVGAFVLLMAVPLGVSGVQLIPADDGGRGGDADRPAVGASSSTGRSPMFSSRAGDLVDHGDWARTEHRPREPPP